MSSNVATNGRCGDGNHQPSPAPSVPHLPKEAVLVKSSEMPAGSVEVAGYDFNQGVDYPRLLGSYNKCGLQATNLGLAVEEVQKMIDSRNEPLPPPEADDERSRTFTALDDRPIPSCTIFLGYTSNLISAGTREVIRFLAQHNLVDCLVSSAGGIEEDFIKCLAPTFLGDFQLKGAALRKQGINRIGNMLVPNNNYCHFEDWIVPILDQMLEEQKMNQTRWTPSRVIRRLGKEINDERSVYYWAYKNNIPVFCPGLTDGSLGDMLYFHSYKNPGLVIDIVEDVKLLNDMAVHSRKTGMIILGGGAMKHHIANANLMRNGADYCLYVNTGQEFDGSDSGARPDEAVSWGKIKLEARPVKVYCDASIAFPLIVAETFAKDFHATKNNCIVK